MKEKTKKIICYGALVTIFITIIFRRLIISQIWPIFTENKDLAYPIYLIIIMLLVIFFTKNDIFYKKSPEERKRDIIDKDLLRKRKFTRNIYAWTLIIIFLWIVVDLLNKRTDRVIILCGFGLFFIIAVFLINKYGHKND